MKKTTWLMGAAVAAVFASSLSPQNCSAQETTGVFLRAVGVSTNANGKVTYHEFNNRNLIRLCAHEEGLTNFAGLSLVYDRAADAIEVVSGTNQTVVCTPLSFAGGVSVGNTNGTWVRRLTYVYWETNQMASGTMTANESYVFGPTNQVQFFSLRGRLQFALPGNGTNTPAIFTGSIASASSFRFREQDGHERDGKMRFGRFDRRD